MASVPAWTRSHPDACNRVWLTSGHLLGTGKDKWAPQEEVEVKDVGHLIGSHQRVGSAAPTSSGHATWQEEEEVGNQTQCQPSLLPPGQRPTGAPGSPRT